MLLVVVYGLKTADYGWLDQFYPAHRLMTEAKNRSIPLRFLFPSDIPAFLSEPRSPAELEDTLILVRGTVGTALVRSLEHAGFRCVNASRALELAADKLEAARFLERNGWPTPRTRTLNEVLEGDVVPVFPLVAKPRRGCRGEGVTLVRGREELEALPGDALIQDFIAESAGRDLRVFFAGGEILATVVRESSDGGFRSNTATGGRMRRVSGCPEGKTALDIACRAGLWYGTVDFLFLDAVSPPDAGRLTVCEINGAPGYESMETECGTDIAGRLLDLLVRDFG